MTKKLPCFYPSCTQKKVDKLCKLVLTNVEDSNVVDLPFCTYHAYIVMGGKFTAEEVAPATSEFKISGPFLEVELVEQVIAAREMIARIKGKDNL